MGGNVDGEQGRAPAQPYLLWAAVKSTCPCDEPHAGFSQTFWGLRVIPRLQFTEPRFRTTVSIAN